MPRLVVPVLLVALAACGGPKPSDRAHEVVAAPPDAAPQLAPAASTQAPLPRAPGSSRARLRLTLRSTPPGAAATIDGRLVGTTPVRWEMDDDGRIHEFAFVLRGYETWRLRFSPSHDGVVHAPLHPVPDEDAGVAP